MTAMAAESAWDVHRGVDFPRGYHVEITDGKIIMTPQGLTQMKVIFKAARQIEDQLAERGDYISDVMVDFPTSLYGYAPDLAIVGPDAELNGRGRYEWHDLEAVLEVGSKSTQDNDFVKKMALYAECAIPLYVVIDPATALCTVHSDPQATGSYARSEPVPFGEDLVLPLEGRTIVIDTTGFPRD
ncbi:Uma2 family endonuclease [Kitasatospora sp. NBC_01287]|uniref:Uma2 family endonuclease n=1 Tax=Kitasatospora sp. NBC_01287 TaxID=2903573 RepID=UPI00225A0A10|nr:Uma2 family endonuclease [Kitasatospora sp. NBC_01287]MCX4749666.1 Uma2 family endonuclease [Kitasatospora sp. NBC_01287]